jgi:hypothetical protein
LVLSDFVFAPKLLINQSLQPADFYQTGEKHSLFTESTARKNQEKTMESSGCVHQVYLRLRGLPPRRNSLVKNEEQAESVA